MINYDYIIGIQIDHIATVNNSHIEDDDWEPNLDYDLYEETVRRIFFSRKTN